VLATPAVQDAVLGPGDNQHPLRRMFHGLLTFFASTYANVFGISDGPPLHDPLAIAVILEILGVEDFGFRNLPTESVVERHATGSGGGSEKDVRWKVRVVTQGTHVGKGEEFPDDVVEKEKIGMLGRIMVEELESGAEGVRIPRQVTRVERFWEVICAAVDKAQGSVDGKRIWNE
jgi:uridine nucleosidase